MNPASALLKMVLVVRVRLLVKPTDRNSVPMVLMKISVYQTNPATSATTTHPPHDGAGPADAGPWMTGCSAGTSTAVCGIETTVCGSRLHANTAQEYSDGMVGKMGNDREARRQRPNTPHHACADEMAFIAAVSNPSTVPQQPSHARQTVIVREAGTESSSIPHPNLLGILQSLYWHERP